jgi:hypothetical protein
MRRNVNEQQFSAIITKLIQDSKRVSQVTEHVQQNVVVNEEVKKAFIINNNNGHSSASRHNIKKQ